jgi:phosphohistidine phosphatase
MDLYLIRHADALPLGEGGIVEDAERPLSDVGKGQAKALAAALNKRGVHLTRLLSSPALRAKQTAEFMLAVWSGAPVPLEVCDNLAIGFKSRKLARTLEDYTDSALALIGHQPDLAEFAAWLVGSRKARLDLAKGGVACVNCANGVAKGGGTLEWLVTPAWYS